MAQRCPSGKIRHSSLERAKVAARAFARHLNQEHKIAHTMYAYRCEKCRGGWHLTRQGMGTILVLPAAPEELQRWAMDG
jgi:hypothetical protein